MGEQTAPETTSDAATARANASARAKLLGWARRTIDLVPTSWLITGAGGVLLAMTAVFGGLATAPVEPIPEIAVGDVYKGSDFEITVVGVELRTERGNAMVFPDDAKGEKVLAVTLDVVNTYEKPRSSTSLNPKKPTSIDGVRIEGLDNAPSLSRADDVSASPQLQPDVPVRVIAAWLVGPDDLRAGDRIKLSLPDSTRYVGSSILKGQTYWDDARVGATVTAPVTEAKAP